MHDAGMLGDSPSLRCAASVPLVLQHYTSAVDVWSVGCCFAELIGVKPLFPGGNYVEQLELITGLLGETGSPCNLIADARICSMQ